MSRTAVRATQSPIQRVLEVLSFGVKPSECEALSSSVVKSESEKFLHLRLYLLKYVRTEKTGLNYYRSIGIFLQLLSPQ
jgi:hypothetical protein